MADVPKLSTAFASDRSMFRDPRQHDEHHLRCIRQLPCLSTGRFGVEACHIRFADPHHGKRQTGMAEKPHDRWTVPLSPAEHRRQHSMSERAFWEALGIDPCAIAIKLWAVTGQIDAMRDIILNAVEIRKW